MKKLKRNERIEKYQRANIRRVTIKLNINTMKDEIEWLESKHSMQGYIIDLIRKDMDKTVDNYEYIWNELRFQLENAINDRESEISTKRKIVFKKILDYMDILEFSS